LLFLVSYPSTNHVRSSLAIDERTASNALDLGYAIEALRHLVVVFSAKTRQPVGTESGMTLQLDPVTGDVDSAKTSRSFLMEWRCVASESATATVPCLTDVASEF
jgi:hypothetical protein